MMSGVYETSVHRLSRFSDAPTHNVGREIPTPGPHDRAASC